jgi:hypothetical protein
MVLAPPAFMRGPCCVVYGLSYLPSTDQGSHLARAPPSSDIKTDASLMLRTYIVPSQSLPAIGDKDRIIDPTELIISLVSL